MIEFFLPMKKIPTTTHQQKKVNVRSGKPIFYEPEDLKNARAKFETLLAHHVPLNKIEGAIRLTVKWCFPRIKKSYDGQYKTTKPDTDNLQKLLKDCMTKLGYWQDDAQVASEIAEKFWADTLISLADKFQNGWRAAIRRAKKSVLLPTLIGYGQCHRLAKFASNTMMMN